MDGGDTPALERYRDERAKLAKLDRLEREGSLLPVEDVHEFLLLLQRIIRSLGESFQRNSMLEEFEMLEEALSDYERELRNRFGGDSSDSNESNS